MEELTLAVFDAFVALLDSHDYSFDYSDDGRVWRNGRDQQKVIEGMMTRYIPLQAVYALYHSYWWSGNHTQWQQRRVVRDTEVSRLRSLVKEFEPA
jgi:hypothetical protein